MQSGLDDIGNTYVEIDYTSQHLWYYKDGSLVTDTGIVSGKHQPRKRLTGWHL